MGRYLDVAKETKNLAVLPECSPAPNAITWPFFPLPAMQAPNLLEDHFDCSASDVLDILTKAGQPVTHSGIVKVLCERGHDRIDAKLAIARCQMRHWIEHNLVAGYILS